MITFAVALSTFIVGFAASTIFWEYQFRRSRERRISIGGVGGAGNIREIGFEQIRYYRQDEVTVKNGVAYLKPNVPFKCEICWGSGEATYFEEPGNCRACNGSGFIVGN